MSELALFLVGVLVTTIVGGAIALLVWGAANEPGSRMQTPARSARPVPVLVRNRMAGRR